MLTEHQQLLLETLQTKGDWMRRSELAAALGQDRLSLSDMSAIDRLAEDGLVIVEVSDELSPHGQQVRYRSARPK